MQVERILEINNMRTVTKDVVETARESLNERKAGVSKSFVF